MVLVYPHSEILIPAFVLLLLLFVFFLFCCHVWEKSYFVMIFKLVFFKMILVCYQLEEPSIKPASWNLYNFGGCPKWLKWSSQSRPMTEFVWKNHPQTPDQPSLFLSLEETQLQLILWFCNEAADRQPTWMQHWSYARLRLNMYGKAI